jgi:hypothetical protein
VRLPFCLPQNEQGVHGSDLYSRLSPQRTSFTKWGPSGNEGLNLFIEGGRINGEITSERRRSHSCPEFLQDVRPDFSAVQGGCGVFASAIRVLNLRNSEDFSFLLFAFFSISRFCILIFRF